MTSNLTLRPARDDDRPAMEQICAHTWEWGDYLPDVWDDWLADENGVMLIGELKSQAVALSKITFQTPDQVWLEGMRVHPDFRQRGIATRFLDYSLDYARAHRANVVRLATGGRNTAAHTVLSRAGMSCVGRYALWTAHPEPDVSSPPVLGPEHNAEVMAFVAESRVLRHTHHLYSAGWAWQELSAQRVSQMLSGRQIVAQWAPDGGLAALATIHFAPEDGELWIGFTDGIQGSLGAERRSPITALASAIRGLAYEAGPEGDESKRVRIMLTDLAWLRGAFGEAGYGPGDWEGELWIFEQWLGQHSGERHAE